MAIDFNDVFMALEQPAACSDIHQSSDPVFHEKDSWWFYDETWSNQHGPYVTEAEARTELTRYAREIVGEALEQAERELAHPGN